MVTLVLDTSDNKKIKVGLIIDGRSDISIKKLVRNDAQAILPMIDEILRKHRLKPKDIFEIKINVGPGSYTGLRIGLAIANAFAFVQKISINGKKNKIILPIYE